jgi:LacI family transcriptional regulator
MKRVSGAAPTVKEVAARAGVSASTVSNVFLGRVPVAERTRERVLAAARGLAYQPDGLAQALRSGQSRTLGLCLPSVTNPTIAAIVDGATRAAQAVGYAVVVCVIEDDVASQEAYLALLRRQRVAAVIAQPVGRGASPYEGLRRAGAALVYVGRRPEGADGDFVTPDYEGATREAVRHLIAVGRQRIALITGPTWLETMRDRALGYAAAHREAGRAMDPRLVTAPDPPGDEGCMARLSHLLRELPVGERPDAIVAGSAWLTRSVLSCLNRLGVAVPSDVALVGTGDLEWAELADPPLSMIEIDGHLIGRQAVRCALDRVREAARARGVAPPRTMVLPTRLVVRRSSAAQPPNDEVREGAAAR